MNIPLELRIAARYLRPKRGKGLLSFVSAVSVLGITLGVAALIVVLSVMSGFDFKIKEGIIDSTPHIYLLNYGGGIDKKKIPAVERKLSLFKEIKAFSPFIFTQAMIKSRFAVAGAAVRGVDPDGERKITNLYKRMTIGDWDCIKEKNTVILGKALADQLGVMPGSQVEVITPAFTVTPFGFLPRSKTLFVCGIFETGMYSVDSTLALVSLKTAGYLTEGDKITGFEIAVRDIYKAAEIADRIAKKLGYPFWCNDWMRMNKPLFSALKLEKITMFLILTLIVLVASFSIASTLSMTVMDKSKDIAILCAMGMTPKRISKIFLYEGLLIGLIGMLSGLLLGLLVCFIIARYKIITLPQDVYYISSLPVKIKPLDVFAVCLASFVITLISTYIPSRQVLRLSPVDILRYE